MIKVSPVQMVLHYFRGHAHFALHSPDYLLIDVHRRIILGNCAIVSIA